MARICIPYATSEGQTAKIAAHVADVVRSHGHEADEVDLKASRPGAPSGYDGVIVGSSIHMGHHDKHVARVRAASTARPSRGCPRRSSR